MTVLREPGGAPGSVPQRSRSPDAVTAPPVTDAAPPVTDAAPPVADAAPPVGDPVTAPAAPVTDAAPAGAQSSPPAAPAGSAPRADVLRLAPGRLPAVSPEALDDPALHEARRRRLLVQRARRRARWWYPLRVLVLIPALLLTALYLDQSLSAALIWPTQGASFVPLDQNTGTAPGRRDRMVIVAGGLNTKSGLSAASALAPSLGDSGTRLFSLRYGNGIYDGDIDAKFDALYQRLHPRELALFGSSMGGDVVLNLAAHVQASYGGRDGPDGEPLLRISAIYLDSTPLGPQNVRYAGRTKAAAITDVTEALNTEGGGLTRLLGEVFATRDQWWHSGFPVMNLNVTPLQNKIAEVFRDKVTFDGISTQLVSDQYGVIRRFDPAGTLSRLDPATRIVYFMPLNPYADHVIAVEQVEPELIGYARQFGLSLTIVPVAHGFHAAASFLPDTYNAAIKALRPPEQPPAEPGD